MSAPAHCPSAPIPTDPAGPNTHHATRTTACARLLSTLLDTPNCPGIATVLLRCCSGVARLLFPWVSLGYPLSLARAFSESAYHSRRDFGSLTPSPTSLGLILTALALPLFKGNRIFLPPQFSAAQSQHRRLARLRHDAKSACHAARETSVESNVVRSLWSASPVHGDFNR